MSASTSVWRSWRACAAPAFDIPSAHARVIRARVSPPAPRQPRPAHQLSLLIFRQHDHRGRRTRMRHALQAGRSNSQNSWRITLARG